MTFRAFSSSLSYFSSLLKILHQIIEAWRLDRDPSGCKRSQYHYLRIIKMEAEHYSITFECYSPNFDDVNHKGRHELVNIILGLVLDTRAPSELLVG